MATKRSHCEITYNDKVFSLEQIDMGTTLPNDDEKIRNLKRPRLTTYYGDETDFNTLEKTLCQNCSIL